MRSWCCLLLLAVAQPAFAGDGDGPYYGPMKRWHGIGFKFGVADGFDKDGSWRIDAATRGGEAIDMAMYRAAERAREQGYAYVELLGGRGSRAPGIESATLYARPSRSSAPPVTCRSARRDTCYTADVATLLRVLGGPDGTQPGVAIVDHRDGYGRAVVIAGYGIGAATPAMSRMVPRVSVPPAPLSPPVARRIPSVAARPSAYQQAMKAAQGVRGREPTQGWTVSD